MVAVVWLRRRRRKRLSREGDIAPLLPEGEPVLLLPDGPLVPEDHVAPLLRRVARRRGQDAGGRKMRCFRGDASAKSTESHSSPDRVAFGHYHLEIWL